MEKWCGRVAVVTGASTGIGAAISKTLVRHGINVVGVARRHHRLQEVCDSVKQESGTFYPFQGDVSSENNVEEIFKWVKEKFETIDILVNNAGIMRPGRLCDQNLKFIKDTMDINLMGFIYCTRKAIKLMKETQVVDGVIIQLNRYLGSEIGHEILAIGPEPIYGAYPISKFGITALTEILRHELWFQRSTIRVSSISPGYCLTELHISSAEAMGEDDRNQQFTSSKNSIELHGLKADDVANAVVFILSVDASVQVHDIVIRAVGDTMINRPPPI